MKGSAVTSQSWFSTVVLVSLLFSSPAVYAEDYVLTLKDHQFMPPDLTIPANQKIKLVVKNLGPDKAEFESSDLDREQVVSPNAEITVFIGPVDAGSYSYFDDFHHASIGTITAK